MRLPLLLLLVSAVWAAPLRAAEPAGPAKSAAEPPAVQPAAARPVHPLAESFRVFCGEWMEKLAEREIRNRGAIKWDTGLNWVQGTYTGFAPDHTCIVDGSGEASVGKITYREVKYEKRGASVDDAERRPPHPLETTEVTEIFRYEKGAWIY